MNKILLPIVMFSLLTGLFLYSFLHVSNSDASEPRSIRVKGEFVLVDEVDLLTRMNELSGRYPVRQDFLDEVGLMLAAEPYVLSSSIRFSWPNDVVIEIVEISPIAVIAGKGVLLKDCRVMKAGKGELTTGLVTVDAVDVAYIHSHCQELINVLPMLNSMSVTQVEVLANGDFSLHVSEGRIVASLQDIRESEDKIIRAAEFLTTAKPGGIYIDMRYASGAAIGRVAEL